jgi:hypothetical protein
LLPVPSPLLNDWAKAGDATLITARTAMRASFDVLIMEILLYAADNGMSRHGCWSGDVLGSGDF